MTALLRPTHKRGRTGQYLSRFQTDWQHDQVPPAVRGMDLSLRVQRAEEDEDGGNGTFEGWGCIYGVQDSYGTTFQPGCFGAGGLQESAYALLWMHNPLVPIATFTAEEREQGLWIAGEYDPTPEAQTARARALSGSAPELSVGFVWLDDGGEDDPDLITKARLVETSQITLRMAAVPGAGFQDVRDEDLTEADRKRLGAMLDLLTLED